MNNYNRVSSSLTGIYNRKVPYGGGAPGMVKTNTQTLPNGGGTYNPAGKSEIVPTPIFQGAQAPVTPQTPIEQAPDLYEKYRDPKTGDVMSPEEWAIYLGNKVPKGSGQIPNYAGDAMTNPNESANQLTGRARNLNNARNDIATGTTDPYGVGNKSGIAYSPTELKAIENAYAGIYDPALNDVFSRLKDKQDEEKEKSEKESIIFKTNEAIRQWKAINGISKGANGGDTNYDFSKSAVADGASNAGMGLKDFQALESDDLKNFYINPPKGKGSNGTMVPIYQNFEEDIKFIVDGELERQILIDEITASTRLSPDVKTYFLNKIPNVTEEEKEWYMNEFWGKIPFVK